MSAQAQLGRIGNTPVLILKEGTTRSRGKEAQSANISAARAIAEAVRTALGPRGMDKMLVDSLGDVVITNDGATILDEMDVQHPAAKMMVEVAKTQDDEVGDGTTSIVVLAGELLKRAEDLLDQNIHPTIIVSGYKKAAEKAVEILNELAQPVKPEDEDTLKKIAITSMNSKSLATAKDHFANLAVQAVKQIAREDDGALKADIDLINVVKKHGKSLAETELVRGMIIDKEVVHPGMPKRVEEAKIALIDAPLEVEKPEFDAQIRISDPAQMKAFLAEEEKILKGFVDKIVKSGANVVFCEKGIDDLAQHYLAKAGILAARRVKRSDMEKLAKTTGGVMVSNLDDLTEKQLGYAKVVEELKIAGGELIFVRECKNPKAVSILIRGGTDHVIDEAERALHDSLCVVRDVIETGKIVPGGGAVEIEVAKRLRDYAGTVGGREQLAIQAFADAVEVIPLTLAENGGYDPMDILVELRAKHEDKNKGISYGINLDTGKPGDMYKAGVIEPYVVKKQIIKAASEAAMMILRIDDVIAAKTAEKPAGMPEGGPGMGGMGGMGGGMGMM